MGTPSACSAHSRAASTGVGDADEAVAGRACDVLGPALAPQPHSDMDDAKPAHPHRSLCDGEVRVVAARERVEIDPLVGAVQPADDRPEDDGRDARLGEQGGVGPERDAADLDVAEVPVQCRHDDLVCGRLERAATERQADDRARSRCERLELGPHVLEGLTRDQSTVTSSTIPNSTMSCGARGR